MVLFAGIAMRSKLETAWAEFFDTHGIPWAYEPEVLQLGPITYCPDFWIERSRTVVEVKGILDHAEQYKLAQVAADLAVAGQLLVLATAPAGKNFSLVWPVPRESGSPFHLSRDIAFVRCAGCEAWQFIPTCGSWECRVCGHYDGAATHSEFRYSRGR